MVESLIVTPRKPGNVTLLELVEWIMKFPFTIVKARGTWSSRCGFCDTEMGRHGYPMRLLKVSNDISTHSAVCTEIKE